MLTRKNPTDAATLAAEKEALLALLLAEEGLDVAPVDTITPRQQAADPLLSFAQRRLWYLAQLEPHSPTYNVSNAVRLTGQLDRAALQQSFSEVVRRHEVLRAIFPTVEGRPLPMILPMTTARLAVVDLRHLPAPERSSQAEQLVGREARRPFDLAHGPLVRGSLLWLGEQEHVLLLTMHHIVSDAWSRGILIREVVALYEAFSAGVPSPLPDLAIQYADFAHWQHQRLQGAVLETQRAYWTQQLGDGLPVLELPTDRPRPALQTFQGARHTFVLPRTLAVALRTLGLQEGVTLFMTLLAAFQTLLYRYTGCDDMPIGTPVANRTRVETEGLIGFFVNTLVLRTDLAGNPSFRELLQRVREVTLAAHTYQDMPFELLVDELRPARDPGHTPLFQVMFMLQNTLQETMALPGLTLSPLRAENGTAKFDVTLTMIEGADGLTGVLEYRTDLFDAATITRLLGHYQTVLEGIIAQPDQRLADVPLLTAAEQQLFVDWNATLAAYPQDVGIHQLFEAQVARTPDAIALVYDEQQMSYQELNRCANQLAHYLRRQGVGPEVLVGLCVERSLDLVIGLLGILKAGGAYVPLDPAYPLARLAFMLGDSQAPILLTQQHLVASLPAPQARVVRLDTDWAAMAREPAHNPAWGTAGTQLAYVLYTSGSTGEPKGVQIPHRAVVNFLHSMLQQPGLTAQDVLLAITTVAFDIAALEVFLPLLVGARVVVVSRVGAADGQQLLQTLTDTQATVMQATPATWRLLLAGGWTGSPQLAVLCGGEALPRELAQQLLGRVAAVWNLYGPTETTIWSAVSQVVPEDGAVPLGHPMANTQFYVLDCHLHPVPIGIPGELYIGGAGVAWGYRSRPGLTAERFIANPLSGTVGARLYKTGDLVRYWPDGRLEFLGRLDQQVKLRGFRIELGEIEAVLSQHPTVREAVVIAREEASGHKRLVAYVVPHPDQAPSRGALGSFLQAQLPDYMVPATFVFLAALPLTPNGKVERRALPVPDAIRSPLEEGFVAPRTAAEALLAGIWAQVLGLEQVGIHDNFFVLGGDSILSIQIIARATAVGLRFTPRQVFQHQTIAELVAVAGMGPALHAPQSPVTGLAPLMPAPAAGGDTSTAFSLVQLGQEQLEQAFGEIAFEGEDA